MSTRTLNEYMYILRVQDHLTSTSTFNKQVQLNETSTTNKYKYNKQVQVKITSTITKKQVQVHEISKSIWNKYKYMKQVQEHETSTSTWNKYNYMIQLDVQAWKRVKKVLVL